MLREGSGEPLVLLHGVLGSERRLAPRRPAARARLRDDRADGARPQGRDRARPSTRSTLDQIDRRRRAPARRARPRAAAPRRQLDGRLDRARTRPPRPRRLGLRALPGRLLGGRLGRERERSFKVLLNGRRDARRGRRICPVLGRSARFRRWAMQQRLPPRRPAQPPGVRRHRPGHDRLRHRRGADRPGNQFAPLEALLPDHRRLGGGGSALPARRLPRAGARS